jgi:hypothetical protein
VSAAIAVAAVTGAAPPDGSRGARWRRRAGWGMIRSMRSLCSCSLACLAACTFTRAEDKIDAPPPPDTPDAGEFMVIETLAVPSVSTGAGMPSPVITSKKVLQSGVTYRLRASGTFYTAIQTLADAEYFDVDPGRTPMDMPSGVDVGLAVDEASPTSTRAFKWGAYSVGHVYEAAFIGKGATITAQVHDNNYMVNSGTLTLEILERK